MTIGKTYIYMYTVHTSSAFHFMKKNESLHNRLQGNLNFWELNQKYRIIPFEVPFISSYALFASANPSILSVLKPNSWSYNFVEVSGHNLDSSQTWGVHIQCLHYKPFKPLLLGRGGGGNLIKEVTVNSQEENSLRRLSQLRPRIRPLERFQRNTLKIKEDPDPDGWVYTIK